MERELTKNNSFLNGVVIKFMLPSIFAMVATSIGALIDTVIVGMYLNEAGLSAMSLVSPVYLVYYTIGAVFGIGGSIVANISVGKNNFRRYRRVFTYCFWILATVAVVATVLGMTFLDQFALSLGGQGEAQRLAKEYLRYYIPGGAFTLMVYVPLYFLKCEGKPRTSSWLFLLSSVINVALTYIFMSPVFNMGIGGASLATSISMGVVTICGFVILFTRTKETRLVRCRFSFKVVGEIFITGLPNGLNNLCNALRVIFINYMLLHLGLSALLPSFSVVKNVSDLINGIMMGVTAALLSVVGVYFGERDNPSVRNIFKSTAKIGIILVVLASAAVAIFPDFISNAFHIQSPEVFAANKIALVYTSISFLLAFPNILLSGYFSTVKRSVLPSVIVVLRLLVYLVLGTLLLTGIWGGVGIWMSFILAEALTLGTTLILIALVRKKNKELDGLLLDVTQEGSNEISFSVKSNTEDIMFASNKIVEFCEENEISMKKTMMISLALEEMLTIIITKCMEGVQEQFVDVRIKKIKDEVMIRMRNMGKKFDPITYYHENKNNEEAADEILGLRIIVNAAPLVEFRETFGVNNLLIMF